MRVRNEHSGFRVTWKIKMLFPLEIKFMTFMCSRITHCIAYTTTTQNIAIGHFKDQSGRVKMLACRELLSRVMNTSMTFYTGYLLCFWFKCDSEQMYYTPNRGSNSSPPDHDSTFYVTALTTRPSVTSKIFQCAY